MQYLHHVLNLDTVAAAFNIIRMSVHSCQKPIMLCFTLVVAAASVSVLQPQLIAVALVTPRFGT